MIDDLEKNIKEWNEAGGTGIHFTNADEVLKKGNVFYVNISFDGDAFIWIGYIGV